MSIKFACPACYTALSAPESAAGKKAKCKKCEKLVSIPEPAPIANTLLPESQTAQALPEAGPVDLGGIRTTMIVSGVLNLVVAGVWFILSVGMCFPVYGALIALAVVEFVSAANLPGTAAGAKTARTVAIVEIVAGIASLPSLICGVINFIAAGKSINN